MVEILEYVLVFAVTASISGFSVVILSGSLPILGQSQVHAQLDEISGAAGLAELKGNSSVVLPLSNASISCSGGVVSLSSGGSDYSTNVGYPCHFGFTGLTCLCTLTFTRGEGELQLKVVG